MLAEAGLRRGAVTPEEIRALEPALTPLVSLLDDATKIVTSRLGPDRFRVAGTAEFNGFNPGGHPKCPTYGHPNCSTLAAVN